MAADTLTIEPQLLRWARERAALAPDELAQKVGLKPERVTEWEQTGKITFSRLERVASKTYTPIGYLFLQTPPAESLPITDYRTDSGDGVSRPSPNLLDAIAHCQQRQNWYRDYLIEAGEEALPFVGSASLQDRADDVARRIRETLELDTSQRAVAPTWDAALTGMVARAESARILVMRNGVVGNKTHRKLDVEEFRGFALADEYAPLVFINSADASVARTSTLAHELAHLWLGQSGVSDAHADSTQAVERYCNDVAAEVLVPRKELQAAWQPSADPLGEAHRLARHFKVSAQVILIRARNTGLISNEQFHQLDELERARPRKPERASGGGDYYRSQTSRLGPRFARAVILSALEGRTPYNEAFHLLGITRADTFDKLAASLGVNG